MHLIYIDDSRQTEPRRRHMGELISVGGVIVPEQSVAAFSTALDGIRAELGIPEGEEIKWKPPRDTFQASAGGELIFELRQRMLQAAIDHDIKSAVVVWDRGHLPWEKTDVEAEILRYLYERITLHLRQHNDVGVIIADQPGGSRADEMKWLADTLGLTREGTRYVTPERVVSPILTAPSHHVPHLQLADLVTAATTAAIAGYSSGMKLAPLLQKLARTNAHGLVGGAGVVLWPPDLMDLYYWIFKETRYIKGGEEHSLGPPNHRFSLRVGRTYQYDDGLSESDKNVS